MTFIFFYFFLSSERLCFSVNMFDNQKSSYLGRNRWFVTLFLDFFFFLNEDRGVPGVIYGLALTFTGSVRKWVVNRLSSEATTN